MGNLIFEEFELQLKFTRLVSINCFGIIQFYNLIHPEDYNNVYKLTLTNYLARDESDFIKKTDRELYDYYCDEDRQFTMYGEI